MSYIKREPLLATAKELQGKPFGAPLIVRAIETAPDEDVVEVVRCKNCQYSYINHKGYWGCHLLASSLEWVDPAGYCCLGERRSPDET